MLLICSMIYQTFKEVYKKKIQGLTKDELELMNSMVIKGRRIWYKEDPTFASREEHSRQSQDEDFVYDDKEMVLGLIPRGEMNMFFDDPEGYSRLADYIEKLIDNLYQFSKKEYYQRTLYKVISKVIMRRKLQQKVKFLMPEYTQKLKDWEHNTLERHNIDKDQLDDNNLEDDF